MMPAATHSLPLVKAFSLTPRALAPCQGLSTMSLQMSPPTASDTFPMTCDPVCDGSPVSAQNWPEVAGRRASDVGMLFPALPLWLQTPPLESANRGPREFEPSLTRWSARHQTPASDHPRKSFAPHAHSRYRAGRRNPCPSMSRLPARARHACCSRRPTLQDIHSIHRAFHG
jgi:hypothetical protein